MSFTGIQLSGHTGTQSKHCLHLSSINSGFTEDHSPVLNSFDVPAPTIIIPSVKSCHFVFTPNFSKYSITSLLLKLLNPIAPHVTEELNEMIGYSPICESEWPVYDEAKTVENTKEIAVQVNGKVRATIEINIEDDEQSIKEKAMDAENVIKHIEGKEIVKVIVVPSSTVYPDSILCFKTIPLLFSLSSAYSSLWWRS